MTAPAWPPQLPNPLVEGYSTQPVDQVLRTEVPGGIQQFRRIGWERIDRISAGWRMDDDQFALFRSWYSNLKWSDVGDSNDFSGWTVANSTISDNAAFNPRNAKAWRVTENTVTATHAASRAVFGLADNTTVLTTISFRRDIGRNARVGFLSKTSGLVGGTVNCNDGAIMATSGSPSLFRVEERDSNFFRATVRGSVGTGFGSPRIFAGLANGTTTSYAGTGTNFMDFAEANMRNSNSGVPLYGSTDSNGKLEGAAGGAAWFKCPLSFGGPVNKWLEARFDGPYRATNTDGFIWDVRANLEVRYI